MTDKLKNAFDGICAEENLKMNTTLFLQKELLRRSQIEGRTAFKNYAVAFASAIVIFWSGIFAYAAYFTPIAYVDVEVNPSIEFMLNRFDRVIGTYAYNKDGEELIKNLSVKYKNYDEALVVLMDVLDEQGYFQNGGLVSVALQAGNKKKETLLLTNIQAGIENYLAGNYHTTQLDIFPVSENTRSYSHELGISSAKYAAIQELIGVDPTASIESCRGHSISEIKQLTQEHVGHHGNGHHGGGH